MAGNAKPAGGDGGNREFLVSNWKPYQKNTLKGFFTLTLPSGLVVHQCMLHESHGTRWIGLAGQRYTKADGTTSYTPIVELASREARERFQAAALRAVDRFFRGGGHGG